MPFTRYLSPQRTLLLKSRDRHEVIEELVGALCQELPGLEDEAVLQAVEAREKEISTQIAPEFAIPHARIAGLGRFILAAGLSRDGVTWGSQEEPPVRLVVLLVGDAADARGHLEVLGQLASVLKGEQIIERLEPVATSPEALYQALVSLHEDAGPPPAPVQPVVNRTVYENACRICRDIQAAALLTLADDVTDLSFIQAKPEGCAAVLATSSRSRRQAGFFDAVIDVPIAGLAALHRLDLAVLSAVSEGLADKGQTLVCLYGGSGTGRLDALKVVDVERDFELLLSFRAEVRSGDIDHQVLNSLLNVATEIAREGREGKAVGALFVLGDAEQVLVRSQQMVVNPFKGHPEEERNALDPSLHDTLKEFSVIDGAIVVRGDGVIMAAGTYLNVQGVPVSLPAGLGSRHAAAAAITAVTAAVAIVVSQSTGTVRLFKDGKEILSLKKDLR